MAVANLQVSNDSCSGIHRKLEKTWKRHVTPLNPALLFYRYLKHTSHTRLTAGSLQHQRNYNPSKDRLRPAANMKPRNPSKRGEILFGDGNEHRCPAGPLSGPPSPNFTIKSTQREKKRERWGACVPKCVFPKMCFCLKNVFPLRWVLIKRQGEETMGAQSSQQRVTQLHTVAASQWHL